MKNEQIFKILGFALLLLSPVFIEEGNRFFPFIGIFTGAMLLYLSKRTDERKSYLSNIKLVIPLVFGFITFGYVLVKI